MIQKIPSQNWYQSNQNPSARFEIYCYCNSSSEFEEVFRSNNLVRGFDRENIVIVSSIVEWINGLISDSSADFVVVCNRFVVLPIDIHDLIAQTIKAANEEFGSIHWGLIGNVGIDVVSNDIVYFQSYYYSSPLMSGSTGPRLVSFLRDGIIIINIKNLRTRGIFVHLTQHSSAYAVQLSAECYLKELVCAADSRLFALYKKNDLQAECDLFKRQVAAYLGEVDTDNGVADSINFCEKHHYFTLVRDVLYRQLNAKGQRVTLFIRTRLDRMQYLQRCLDSIKAAQKYLPLYISLEVYLLVNNDNINERAEKIASIQSQHAALAIVVVLCELRGIHFPRVEALMIGIERLPHVENSFIWIIDDDDSVVPEAFRLLPLILKENIITIGNSIAYMEVVPKKHTDYATGGEVAHCIYQSADYFKIFLGKNTIPCCSVIYPEAILRNIITQYPLKGDYYEDYTLLLFATHIAEVYPSNIDICRISYHGNNTVFEKERSRWDSSYATFVSGVVNTAVLSSWVSALLKSYISLMNINLSNSNRLLSIEEELSSAKDKLHNVSSELLAIKQTIGWKMLLRIYYIIDVLFPRGSRIGKVYGDSIKFIKRALQAVRRHQKNIAIHKQGLVSHLLRRIFFAVRFHQKISLKAKLYFFLLEKKCLIHFPPVEKPLISIVLLTYNKAEYSLQCLLSILKHCNNISYEIVVVENNSTDLTRKMLAKIQNIRIILNTENLGFVGGCNSGAQVARGKFIYFLNNDTCLKKGSLQALIETLEGDELCGAVGSKLVYPNGILQEAGSIVWSDGSTYGYGRGDQTSRPEYNYRRRVDFCSAASILIRRNLFIELGGFDARYAPAYYEDADLCFALASAGYSVIYQPMSEVCHFEFTSSSKIHAKELMQINRKKFCDKWKSLLNTKYAPMPENILIARDSRIAKTLLYIDDRVPDPSLGSGSNRAFVLVNAMADLGYKTTFYPIDQFIYSPSVVGSLQKSGIEVIVGSEQLVYFLSFRHDFYDLVVISRPHNLKKNYKQLRKFFPRSTLIYDAEALFSVRDKLMHKVGARVSDNQTWEFDEEISLIEKADAVLTVSNQEKMLIEERIGRKYNIGVIGHALPLRRSNRPFEERQDILFVGSFPCECSPNEDALLTFIQKHSEKLFSLCGARLIIVGANPPPAIQRLESERIIIEGFVDDLAPFYEKCRVFIAPHRYAAGVPWKVHEAMSYGLPCVISALLSKQLQVADGDQVLVGDDDIFSEKIFELYNDCELWNKVQGNMMKYVRETCDPSKFKMRLQEYFQQFEQMNFFKK